MALVQLIRLVILLIEGSLNEGRNRKILTIQIIFDIQVSA